MGHGGSRSTTPEERSLWAKVMQNVTAFHPKHPKPQTNAHPPPEPPARKKPVHQPIPDFRIGEESRDSNPSHDIASDAYQHLNTSPQRMDKKKHEKLKRGRLTPEARIDLHGMTKAEAHSALIRFIQEADNAGHRLLLVITGKGLNSKYDDPLSKHRGGVLKQAVPYWLSTPPLSQLVLHMSEAHPKHGGSGALYVYLRRTT